MARDTTPIGTDVIIGENTPPVETTVEALIRAYNRQPLNTNLADGNTIRWDATAGAWVPSSGSSTAPLSIGNYVGPPSTLTTSVRPEATAQYSPLDVDAAATLDRIAVQVTSAGTAGAVIRLGIYDDNDGLPGDLVLDAGTVDATTTGVKEIIINQALSVGRYWLTAVVQGGATTRPTTYANNGALRSVGGAAANALTQLLVGYNSAATVTGALPATADSSGGPAAVAHRVVVRRAS